MVPQLLLLELPNVLLLITIGVYLYSLWHINPLLKWTSSVHIVHSLHVNLDEVLLC